MELFLLWRASHVAARDVREALQRMLEPLFAVQPEVVVRRDGNPSLLVAHLPVPGWKQPFFEEDETEWTQAVEYPLDWTGSLLAAARHLENGPASLLRDLSPPFSLLWNARDTNEIVLQNDGLGQAQLFEYQSDPLWAVTNHIMAFKALGVTLEPVAEEWAAATTLGWFPLEMSGYRHVKLLGPATQLRVGAHGVRRTTVEILGQWLHPEPRPQEAWLEIGRTSLLRYIETASARWDDASVGLTGGEDSRAVVSSLQVLRTPFRARVKGRAGSPDVTLAHELARIAAIPLRHDDLAEQPSDDPDCWRHDIALALQWRAGHMDFDKHKTLFANGRRLGAGEVNIMGQHGEIARAFHYGKAMRLYPDGEVPDDARMEERFVARRLAARVPYLRPDLTGRVSEIIRAAFRRAHDHRLTGIARLDFFYLFENTRRGNAASLAAQTGVVVTPFLNPDLIRAAFALSPAAKAHHFLHRHIVAVNEPRWQPVPFDGKDSSASLQRGDSRYYDARRSWREAGASLIEDALRYGGFWTEVFDPDLARRYAFDAPDELTMLALLPAELSSRA